MSIGSILKTASGGGRQTGEICPDQECGVDLRNRKVRFQLTEEQEMKADNPFCPLGQRKVKKVRRGKRKITPEMWRKINRYMQDEDSVADKMPIKDLRINNEHTGKKLDIGGDAGQRAEDEQTPTQAGYLMDRESAAFVDKFMKCWGKILKMEIKKEGFRDGLKQNPKEPPEKGKTEE